MIKINLKGSPVQQRIESNVALSPDFLKTVQILENKHIADKVQSAVKLAVSEASKHLLPGDKQGFDKYHYNRARIKSQATVDWNVGYASGKTLKKLSDSLLKTHTYANISKTGNITIKYVIPKQVADILIPEQPVVMKYKALRGMGFAKSHKAISSIAKWIRKKNIVFKDVPAKGRVLKQAFMIYNSWCPEQVGGSFWLPSYADRKKPKIMRERALRIKLNDKAKEKYNEVLEREFSSIKKELSEDLLNKIFKK